MSGNVFITGISGFIGRAIARRLAREGWSVSGMSRSGRAADGCQVIAADVSDTVRFAEELKRADVVLHLAGPTTFAEINDDPCASYCQMVGGTAGLMQEFVKGDGKHFLFMSTGKVYGLPEKLPIAEDSPLRPTTVLGKCKRSTEQAVQFFAAYSGKNYTIVRLFNAYGPGQKDSFLIPAVMRQVSAGELTLGDLHGKRDFIYIDDLVEGLRVLIQAVADNVLRDRLNTFNLGSGMAHSPADIVQAVEGITGTRLRVVVDEGRMRPGEAAEERADITRMRGLEWSPAVSLEEGLRRMLEAGRNVAVG